MPSRLYRPASRGISPHMENAALTTVSGRSLAGVPIEIDAAAQQWIEMDPKLGPLLERTVPVAAEMFDQLRRVKVSVFEDPEGGSSVFDMELVVAGTSDAVVDQLIAFCEKYWNAATREISSETGVSLGRDEE